MSFSVKDFLGNSSSLSSSLCEELLTRCMEHQDLNCFLDLPRDLILENAKLADQYSSSSEGKALRGVPVAVKDVLLTKGQETTSASKILKNFVPLYDATVVKRLRDSGAVLFGKTNMDEFAMGTSNENSAFGAVKNPWDKTRVPGGSSGGSAAAVAAGLVPLALGSDTGGSIRQPASFCGIVGIKPTYGRVSRYGVIAFASSLDQVGAFGASVEDATALLQVISGHDPKDSTSVDLAVPDYSENFGKAIKGMRVGIPQEYFAEGLDKEVKETVESALKQLESLGCELVQISLPHTKYGVAAYYIIAPAEASSNLARYDGIRYGHRAENTEDLLDLYCSSRGEGFGEEVKRRIMIGTYVLSSGYIDAYYLQAQKVRTVIANEFNTAFAEQCDLIASPVTPTTAFKLGEFSSDPLKLYLADTLTIPASLAGLPSMSVPCGFDSVGLPVGLQLIAPAFEEQRMLQVAHAYETSTEWHTKRAID